MDSAYVESFVEELGQSLPRAIIFLKKLERIDLLRNGNLVTCVTREVSGDDLLVSYGDEIQLWRIFEDDFGVDAARLRTRFKSAIDDSRSSLIRIAIPDTIIDDGLLFATLPAERPTGLPFHIDADFFPTSDRKSIVFEDSHDASSEWNRAAIRAAASLVSANLISIRDTFTSESCTFWAILERLNSIYRERRTDQRMPLECFWESLVSSLANAPIIYSEGAMWLTPAEVRIPTGEREIESVPVLRALGLKIVHRDLWRFRNLITGKAVGVKTLTVEDIYKVLKGRGLTDFPQPMPADFQPPEALAMLWQGISGVLDNVQKRAKPQAESLFIQCALAPGLDGRLWPCKVAYSTDDYTRKVFKSLLPDDISFLIEENVPLLEQLCPPFTLEAAIGVLERVATDEVQASWTNGDFDPAELLKWFDNHKSGLTNDLPDRLARLPVFPSAKGLHSLEHLWLPGGFTDPMGLTSLLDVGVLGGLSDFLRSLGINELTFEQYAMQYISGAFEVSGSVSIETKRKHLANLDRRIGEIKTNRELQGKLAATNIIECLDGEFRRPMEVYFLSDEVSIILRDYASYASLPEQSESRRDLYRWLGVSNQPRIMDVLRILKQQTEKPPTQESRSIVIEILEALGGIWGSLSADEKARATALRGMEWLPAEGDTRKWYEPNELYAVFNRSFFDSQAKFIDMPVQVQQRVSGFLADLRVKLHPEPSLVVKHLVRCSNINKKPPRGVYRWLNDNAQTVDVKPLTEVACLWIASRYLQPSQVFWASHPFGRFRVQLGAEFRLYQNLLRSLGIREAPDFKDAIEVLRDVSRDSKNNKLPQEDLDVVFQCWIMLSEALLKGELHTAKLENSLGNTPCVPNKDEHLLRPSWMFFEGRPGLAEKFPEQLKGNCIPRTERVWTAMEAAGVRTLSTVVQGHIDEAPNPKEDEEIRKCVIQRREIIGAILEAIPRQTWSDENSVSPDEIRFYSTDELNVVWELRAFNRKWPPTSPQPVQAHLDVDEKAIYFTPQRNGGRPWASIARELSFAVAPDEAIGSVSPGFTFILEARTLREARVRAQELGIVPVEGLADLFAQGDIVEKFGDVPTAERIPDHSTILGSQGANQDEPRDPALSQDGNQKIEQGVPFAKRLHEVQTIKASRARQRQLWMPGGGPQTGESARKDHEKSIRTGRLGSISSGTVSRWEPVEAANDLAVRFRTMVHSDYGQRCQICSKSFTMPGNRFQVYVVHIVRPSVDHRTNHLGDLLGLCGWHYSLIRYGEWAYLDPETDQPFEDSDKSRGWEQMQTSIAKAPHQIDEVGNSYIGLPIRFWNVYDEWGPDPVTVNEIVRYSIPHWEYLCELLGFNESI